MRRFLMVFGASTLLLMPVQAQQPARHAPSTPLTADDIAEIQHMYARYTYAFDGGVENGQMWAQLFTADGAHIAGAEFVKGHRALAAFASGGLRYERGETVTFVTLTGANTKNPTRVGHFITNVLIEPTAAGANVKAYLMRANIGANGQNTMTPGGIYFDTLVRTPEGWRYQLKHFIGIGNQVPVSVPDSFKAAPKAVTTTSSR